MDESKQPLLPKGTGLFEPRPLLGTVAQALTPIYSTPTADAVIDLYDGAMGFHAHGKSTNGTGSLRLTWTPTPQLRFFGSGWDGFLALNDQGPLPKLSIVGSTHMLSCHVRQIGRDVRGRFFGRCQMQDRMDLSRVMFHLPNWFQAHGGGVAWNATGETVFGRVTLEAAPWRIFLDPVREQRQLEEQLKEEGNYAITHVGQIERTDGAPFSDAQAKELLELLRFFFSFARGFWTPPLLPVAFDEHGQVVFKDWEISQVTPWGFVSSWYTHLEAAMLPRLFPGFLKTWNNPLWHDPLRRSIWWYLSANTQAGGCDGALILAQVALELMAWVVHVEDRHAVRENRFDAMSAADKIRVLLDWLKVNQDTPTQFTALSKMGDQNIPDGPYKLTAVRNALVHPKNRNRLGNDAGPVVEGWALAMWYTELAILRVIDYVGPYVNRLNCRWAGEVEPVPWQS